MVTGNRETGSPRTHSKPFGGVGPRTGHGRPVGVSGSEGRAGGPSREWLLALRLRDPSESCGCRGVCEEWEEVRWAGDQSLGPDSRFFCVGLFQAKGCGEQGPRGLQMCLSDCWTYVCLCVTARLWFGYRVPLFPHVELKVRFSVKCLTWSLLQRCTVGAFLSLGSSFQRDFASGERQLAVTCMYSRSCSCFVFNLNKCDAFTCVWYIVFVFCFFLTIKSRYVLF